MASKVAHLRQLLEILTQSVDAIEVEANKQSATYPALDDIFDPTSPGEQLAMDSAVLQAATLGCSAANQIAAILMMPGLSLFSRTNAYQITASLRVATDGGIAELLRENPSGLHINEIGKRTGTDPTLMARIMRLLATHYIFREVKPNVFANNRLSSLIDTGKSSEWLTEMTKKRYAEGSKDLRLYKKLNTEKFIDSRGVAPVIEHTSDEGLKSAAFLSEYVFGPEPVLPFKRGMDALDCEGFFQWMEKPENNGYMKRASAAFEGASRLEPVANIIRGFDWTKLPESSLVVDIGGGNGSVSLCITEAAPQLHVIVEDRQMVIDNITKPGWAEQEDKKKLIDSGRVQLLAHDFFEPQPPHISGKVDLFLLRFIIHDWPKAECIKILRSLHAAAAPQGRLLVVDHVVPYACPAPDVGKDVPGSNPPLPPTPLLANLGVANTTVYFADMQMMNFLGSQERTIGEFIELFEESGWKLVKVYRPVGSTLPQLECLKA